MRILYLGVFERPYDTEVYISKSLESLGHEVVQIPMTACTIRDIQDAVRRSPPDCILFSKGWFKDKNKEFLEYFKSCGITTVGWFFDLAWGTFREWQVYMHPAFRADIVCTTDGGHEAEFKKAGINHHVLRQGIFEPEAYMADMDYPDKDIVFVGTNAHSYHFRWNHRADLIKWLQETYGDRFGWYGGEDGIRNAKLNQLYANTKIVIGDSVWHPNYWSNRVYETIGRGGFLIFPDIPGLKNEFEYYKHFIPYTINDWKGLKEKIDYFLTRPTERDAIRTAGFLHCKANHTYIMRCKRLVEIINEYRRTHPK